MADLLAGLGALVALERTEGRFDGSWKRWDKYIRSRHSAVPGEVGAACQAGEAVETVEAVEAGGTGDGAVDDGEFGQEKYRNKDMERRVGAVCKALEGLQAWVERSGHQPLGFQDTTVKTNVDEAYSRAGVARGYLDDQGPYPDNTVVRGIMQELEAAEVVMAQLGAAVSKCLVAEGVVMFIK